MMASGYLAAAGSRKPPEYALSPGSGGQGDDAPMTDEPCQFSRRQTLTTLAALCGALVLPSAALAAIPFVSRRIVVSVQGTGRDVILIPGLGSGPEIWDRLIRDVPGYRWHRVHVRGFAGLPPGDNGRGPLLVPLADEIARYAAQAGLGRPTVIGHSMGGLLGLMMAERRPLGLKRLMVVDMLPAGAAMVGGTAEGLGFLARQLRGYFTGTAAGRRTFANILRDATPGGADSDPDVIASALDEIAGTDLGPRLGSILTPITVVPAIPADRDLAAAALRRATDAYRLARGARIAPVGPSGHMVMFDQPEKFARTVRLFLAGY